MVHEGQSLAALRFSLKNNGYTPLPNHGKRPVIENWQVIGYDETGVFKGISDAAIMRWSRIHRATSTGIRVERGLVVIDVDFSLMLPDLLEEFANMVSDIVPGIFDQCLVRKSSGLKEAWFVRLADGETKFGRIASGLWQENPQDPFDDPTVPRGRIEIFAGGAARQFGAFGPHSYEEDDETPKTFYSWDGPSPADTALEALPQVTVGQLSEICNVFDLLMESDKLTKVVGRRDYGEPIFQFVLEADTEIETEKHGVLTVAELEAYVEDYSLEYLRCSGSFHDPSRTRLDSHTIGIGKHGIGIFDFMDGLVYCRRDKQSMESQFHADDLRAQWAAGIARAGATPEMISPPASDPGGSDADGEFRFHDDQASQNEAASEGSSSTFRRAAPVSDIEIVPDEQMTLRNAVDWLLDEYAWCGTAFNGKGGVGRLYPGEGFDLVTVSSFKITMKAFEITEIGERGGRKKINPVDIWLANSGKAIVNGWRFRPDLTSGVFVEDGQRYANNYDPPVHDRPADTEVRVAPFIAFMQRLVPEQIEREWFFDWLGHKVQVPEVPQVAVVMVAEEFGTGRRTLMEILSGVFGKKYVRPAEFGMLTGTSASARFNSYMAESLLTVVDEAVEEDGHKYSQRRTAYETLKTVVDPNGTMPRKFEAKQHTPFFYPSPASLLLATNNRDAMKLPIDDRRFCGLINGSAMTPIERDAIRVWMADAANYAALYWFLLEWEIDPAYDPYIPPMFEAKREMVSLAKTPLDEAYETAMADMVGDLFTVSQLTTAMAAHGTMVGTEWVKQARQLIARKNFRLSDYDPKRLQIKFKGNPEVVYAKRRAVAKQYAANPDNEPIRLQLMRNEPGQK